MLKIQKELVSKDLVGLKCPKKMMPKYITIHESNQDAGAYQMIAWMGSFFNPVSFHFAVDHVEIWQGIECNRTAHHCGDGVEGKGNNQSIGIEICYPGIDELYTEAVKNTVKLVAYLMKSYNIPLNRVVQHHHWSVEECPKRMRKEGKWVDFIKLCEEELKGV